MNQSFSFTSKLWIYGFPEASSWYFINVPVEYSEEIKARTSDFKRGFGSVRVTATIGKTTWKTSIFPDKKSGSYLLPIKKEIRRTNDIDDGAIVNVTISLQT